MPRLGNSENPSGDSAGILLNALRDPKNPVWEALQEGAEEGRLDPAQQRLYGAMVAVHRYKEEGLRRNDRSPVTDADIHQMRAAIQAHALGGRRDLPDGDAFSPDSFRSSDEAVEFLTHLLRRPEKALTVLQRPEVPEARPRAQTLFEGSAALQLPGLNANLRFRSTDPEALGRHLLLPRDVHQLLTLQAGIEGVLASLDRNIEDAVAAVRADQESKIAQATSLLERAHAMIPGLIQTFREALGTRTERVVITNRRSEDTNKSGPKRGDGSGVEVSRRNDLMETREINSTGPAEKGVLALPSLRVHTGASEASQFSAAGFAMREEEEAQVEVHRGPDWAETVAHGDTAFAAAQVTTVRSEGMTIEFHGGSITIGG